MPSWSLRPSLPSDLGFLFQVYASTRMDELAPLNWPAEQVEAFLRMQFEAQDRHYRGQFSQARYDVIRCGNDDVGRLYVDRQDDEILVLDIALLIAFRRRGIGRSILQSLLDEARASGQAVALHVERDNPALGLYLSLGFQEVDEHGVYKLMRHVYQDAGRLSSTPVASGIEDAGVAA